MTAGTVLVVAGGVVALLAAFGIALGSIAMVPLALALGLIGLAVG